MPTEWKQQCDGYATYRWHANGAIEVAGAGFPQYTEDHPKWAKIQSFWDKYGPLLTRYAGQFEIPVSWVVGIVTVESLGDEWACSPCEPPWCGLKDCGGGVAKDGKRYVCCAYGLMQVIDSNARHYGDMPGEMLLGNPDDAIRIGVKIYAENLARSKGDPLMAVRRYNGCAKSVCKGEWVTKCNPECPFGVGGQNGYAEKFALAVNAFLSMDLDPVQPAPPGWQPVDVQERASVGMSIGFLAVGALVGWFGLRALR